MSVCGFLSVTLSLQIDLLTLISLRGEEESNCGKDFATGFPSLAFVLPSPYLLKQKIKYMFCSLLHYVVCISRSHFHCVLKLISLWFFSGVDYGVSMHFCHLQTLWSTNLGIFGGRTQQTADVWI